MKRITRNTVFVTGGGSGIGFGLAKRFAEKGNKVIICGRRADQLELAKKQVPSLEIVVGDVSSETERIRIAHEVIGKFPDVNVLVNNAGIQNRLPPLAKEQSWEPYEKELAINVAAPFHLSMLFLLHFVKKSDAAIINVTSGLAYVPIAFMPMYCATKAALHSLSQSLRQQLKDTPVVVIEMAPPKTNTDLGGKGLHDDGVDLDEYCNHAFSNLEKGLVEFGYGFSEKGRTGSYEERQKLFEMLHKV